jgi:hypothetical protein
MKGEPIREYSGYLIFDELDHSRIAEMSSEIAAAGLDWEFDSTHLEVEYQGRDTNRFVVVLLGRLARLIGSASGEIRCQQTLDDEMDPTFLFFRIKDSCLFEQEGKIERSDIRAVVFRSMNFSDD